MKRRTGLASIIAIAGGLVSIQADAQTATGTRNSPTASQAAPLYKFTYTPIAVPRQPGAVNLPVAKVDSSRQEDWFLQNDQIGVRNVVQPTLTPVLPVGPSTGTAVIIAPGGAFLGLAIDNEGWQVARWLAAHGITAFVLKYRLLPTPNSLAEFEAKFDRMLKGEKVGFAPPEDTPSFALEDGLSALRHVRANAAQYGIDPKKVGFMGFSAGGFLTRTVVQNAGPDMPDFIAPIYPNMAEMTVPENAPPMFLMIAADDFLLERGGTGLFDSWRKAGKPVEFHLIANGGHGFGYGRPGTSSEGWLTLFHRWLEVRGFAGGPDPAVR